MPQQLIYTSAQRGLVAGRSGYCTVARSAAMRDALMLQLEKFSYYQHLSLNGGQERRISACRVFEIRGTRYHVLSHIQDAGLDFTGRTNFLAHHLIFTPEEIRQFASPPIILARWTGWLNSWSKEPEQLENEDWGNLSELSSVVSVPAQNWQALSGEAVNGYGMLEARSGSSFRVDNVSEEQILALFAESLELLELRDPRKDFRVSAWQYTFTTSMQEQDNPADFRWRCLHSDNPASSRFAGPDCRGLTDVRLVRVTSEEKSFAQNGRQAPRIVVQPRDVRLKEGEVAQLSVKAEGVPVPSYQWYSVDKSGAGQIIPNATGPELPLPNPPFGVSRYVVHVINSIGEVTSQIAKVECEKKFKLTPSSSSQAAVTQQAVASSYDPDYETKRDNQRRRLQQEEENRENKNRQIWNKFTMVFGLVVLVVLVAIGYMVLHKNKARGGSDNLGLTQTNEKSPVSLVAQSSPSPMASNSEPTMTKNMVKSDGPTSKTTSQKVLPPDMNQMPPGWAEMPIGEMDLHVADPFHPPYQFELKSSASGFQPKQDNVYYVCITNLNQGFEAQIKIGPTNGLNGIMLRDSGDIGSRFLFVGATPQKIYLYRRDNKGEFDHTNYDYSNLNSNISFRFSLEVKDGKWVPNYSVDSVNWTPFKQFEFSPGSNALVGFAQTSEPNNLPANAKFRQVPITR